MTTTLFGNDEPITLPKKPSYTKPPPHAGAFVRNDAAHTSVQAARSITPTALQELERVVYDVIRTAGAAGLTDEQIVLQTGLGPNSARPRRIALWKRHRVIKYAGFDRETISGRKAKVWVAKECG